MHKKCNSHYYYIKNTLSLIYAYFYQNKYVQTRRFPFVGYSNKNPVGINIENNKDYKKNEMWKIVMK